MKIIVFLIGVFILFCLTGCQTQSEFERGYKIGYDNALQNEGFCECGSEWLTNTSAYVVCTKDFRQCNEIYGLVISD